MVMLDPLPFDDVSTVDPGVFKQAAIWGTVYEVQSSGGSLDPVSYTHLDVYKRQGWAWS